MRAREKTDALAAPVEARLVKSDYVFVVNDVAAKAVLEASSRGRPSRPATTRDPASRAHKKEDTS